MMSKIMAMGVLLTLLCGVGWVFLRDTPRNRITRWRQASSFFFEHAGDFEAAEELNTRVLDLLPRSIYDLLFKARLNKSKGTREGLEEALSIYDKIIVRDDARVLVAHLLKSVVLRSLGRLEEARGAALSVQDSYPYEGQLELGHIAKAANDGLRAIDHYRTALQFAEEDLEKARAHGAIASALLSLLSLNTNSDTLRAGSDKARATCREALDKALSSVQNVEEPPYLWIARLYDQRATVKRPDETPLSTGVEVLASLAKKSREREGDVPRELSLSLGMLRVMTADQEEGALGLDFEEIVATADKDFLLALGHRSSDEARELLDIEGGDQDLDAKNIQLDPRRGDRSDYLRTLMAISQTYLSSSRFEKINADDSTLDLSRRIEDARQCADPEVSDLFDLVSGFGRLKAGDANKAQEVFDSYLNRLVPELHGRALLGVAEKCLSFVPDTPFVFRLLDRMELRDSGAEALRVTERQIRLLIRAKQQERLAEEATRRLDGVLDPLPRLATTPKEHLRVARILRRTRSLGEALDYLARIEMKPPEEESSFRFLSAAWLTENARRAVGSGKSGEAQKLYRSALENYVHSLVQNPDSVVEVTAPLKRTISRVETFSPGQSLTPLLTDAFPAASESDLNRFSATLRHYLLGQFAEALEESDRIASGEKFQPILSFLRGTSYLDNGSRSPLSPSERRAAAEAEFRRVPNALGNRLELASMAMRSSRGAVGPAVLDEILGLCQESGVRGGANLLLAQALEHNIRLSARDPNVDLAEVEKLIVKLQIALRAAIQHHPRNTSAFVALSNSLVLRAEMAARSEGRTSLSPEDYRGSINTLKSAPRLNQKLVATLASFLDHAEDFDAARGYHLALNLIEPSERTMAGLVNHLLKARELDLLEKALLVRDDAAPEPTGKNVAEDFMARVQDLLDSPSVSESDRFRVILGSLSREVSAGREREAYRQLFAAVRDLWFGLPHFESLRCMHLADLSQNRATTSLTPEARASARENTILHYEKALEVFENQDEQVPIHLLNNLSWYLALEDDEAKVARSLELAERARDRLSSRSENPQIYDTYSWALYRNGRVEKARREYEELLVVHEDPGFRFHFARVLNELGDHRRALAELEKALDFPSFADRQKAIQLRAQIQAALRRSVGASAGVLTKI